MGFGGLELRARCAGFSVTEIGNRKKRKAFLYEFPGKIPKQGMGRQSHRLSLKRGAHPKNVRERSVA